MIKLPISCLNKVIVKMIVTQSANFITFLFVSTTYGQQRNPPGVNPQHYQQQQGQFQGHPPPPQQQQFQGQPPQQQFQGQPQGQPQQQFQGQPQQQFQGQPQQQVHQQGQGHPQQHRRVIKDKKEIQ